MSSKYGRNTVVNDPREADMNIPMDLVRQRGAREVDRGEISGIKVSKFQETAIVMLNGRLYYVKAKHAEAWKLVPGTVVKVTLFGGTYYMAVIPSARSIPREIQLLTQRSKGA
ncbi:hypothetical protein D3C78_976760 [compost metagenome]|jgi:hypothetical protein